MGMEQYLEIMPLLTDIVIPMSYDESPASRWQFILKGEHSKHLWHVVSRRTTKLTKLFPNKSVEGVFLLGVRDSGQTCTLVPD